MPTLHHRIQRLSIATLLSLGFLFVMAATVSAHPTVPAHASVLTAIPAIGSTITQAPTTVTVTTAENINPDPKKSNLFVFGPSSEATNRLISQGDAKVSLTNPKEMSVTIKPDPQHSNGVYVVRWITVSALDGDPDEGTFVFTVQPTTPTKAPITTTTTTQASTGGIPLWVPIVVGVLALLIGLGSGLAIGRRGSKSTISRMRKAVAERQEPTDTPSTPTKDV